jgi:hypothetical protein
MWSLPIEELFSGRPDNFPEVPSRGKRTVCDLANFQSQMVEDITEESWRSHLELC